MISTLIVLCSLGLGLIFVLAYWLSPKLRKKIEEPKHVFMEQLVRHNRSIERKVRVRGEIDNAK